MSYTVKNISARAAKTFFVFAAPVTPFVASAEQNKTTRPNIVCIVSEDNTKDYMQHFMGDRGTKAPAIEALAAEGVTFERVWSNAPVSSAARSTLISGLYGVSMGSHYHRGEMMVDMPSNLKMFPAYLRKAGYYTANNAKEDYNINKGDDVWDESSRKASWRNRKAGQPFYYVHNLGDTHEGQMLKSLDKLKADLGDYEPSGGVKLQPNTPDTELFRTCYKFYCKRIEQMDKKVAGVVAQLEKDGLLDNTIILYFADNGGILPISKGYLTEMGLNVPLVIRAPKHLRETLGLPAGTRSKGAISFVDLAPTILDMAQVKIPKAITGKSIIGRELSEETPQFGYADRMGEKYDMVRTMRVGRYKYVRAFQPFNFDALTNTYRAELPTFQELFKLHEEGKLNELQEQFFKPKQAEMLFDMESDPYEMKNLAEQENMQNILLSMREKLIEWQKEQPDLGVIPEYVWVREAGRKSASYAKKNKKRIAAYLDIAALQLIEYSDAKRKLKKALESEDFLERYWALNVCSSFGKEAHKLEKHIKRLSQNEKEPAVRARALEYLALYSKDTKNVECDFVRCLYDAKDAIEANLILNSMTLLAEGYDRRNFEIEARKLKKSILENVLVKSALAKHSIK